MHNEIKHTEEKKIKKSDFRHFVTAETSIAFLSMQTLELDKPRKTQSCRELHYISKKTNFIKF